MHNVMKNILRFIFYFLYSCLYPFLSFLRCGLSVTEGLSDLVVNAIYKDSF